MHVRSTNTLPQLRRAMLTGVSAIALCLGMPAAANADGLTIEAEGAWLQPFGDEVIYGEFLELTPTAIYSHQTIDRGEDYSGRGQVIWHLNDWLSVSGGGGAAKFGNSATATHADLYYQLPNTFLFPQIVTVPEFVGLCPQICEQVYTDGSAQLDTDIEFYDFDVGADVGIGRNGTARFFAGVRYVRFDESLRAAFSNFAYFAYYYQTLDSKRVSSFEGWGPRVGFTADVPIGSSNFSFGGTVAFAALFGDVKTNITSTHTSFFSGPDTFTQSSSSSKTAYSVEVAPQISYTLNGENISARISAGYRFDHYLGIVDTATRQMIAGTPPGGDPTDDAKFDGPFLRVGVKFGSSYSGGQP
jgi:hypothetical protein